MCVGMIRRSVSKLEATLNEMIDKLAESGMVLWLSLHVGFEIRALPVYLKRNLFFYRDTKDSEICR